MSHSMAIQGSWCCSSWYKPSGTFFYRVQKRTEVLPTGCGVGDLSPAHCEQIQSQRRDSQRPRPFDYILATGTRGKDGYFNLIDP
jgi:hypothetical protein